MMLVTLLFTLHAQAPLLCGPAVLSAPAPVLGGRWMMPLPEGAVESNGNLTLQRDGRALQLNFHELHAVAKISLTHSVATLMQLQNQQAAVRQESLRAAPAMELLTPRSPGSETALLGMAYLQHADGTLQRMDVRTQGAAGERDACLALVRAMLLAATPGPTMAPRWPGPHVAWRSPDGSVFLITVGGGVGVDSTGTGVTLRPVAPLESNPPQAGFLVAPKPRWRHQQGNHGAPQTHPAYALGTRITWLTWQDSGRWWSEAMVPFPSLKGPRLTVHLTADAANEAELAQMRGLLESTVVDRPLR